MSDPTIEGLEIVEEIGRGGYATVYRARQARFGRDVAVKVLSARLEEDELARFERECRAVGTLSSHPNVVTVFDAGITAAGSPYLVMELLAGGTLRSVLERSGPLTPYDAIRYGSLLASALHAAHDRGILHRDVKPENVLLAASGVPVLADFGIAWVGGPSITGSGAIVASLAHAAPEVLNGAPASPSSDVYSLASTVTTLLRGRPPFVEGADDSPMVVVRRALRAPVPDLRAIGVHDEVCAVLERALAKDPAARFADAASFGSALAASDPGPISETAERAGPALGLGEAVHHVEATVIRGAGGHRRRRSVIGAVVGGTALAALLAVGALERGTSTPRQAEAAAASESSASSTTTSPGPSSLPSSSTSTPATIEPTVSVSSSATAPLLPASPVSTAPTSQSAMPTTTATVRPVVTEPTISVFGHSVVRRSTNPEYPTLPEACEPRGCTILGVRLRGFEANEQVYLDLRIMDPLLTASWSRGWYRMDSDGNLDTHFPVRADRCVTTATSASAEQPLVYEAVVDGVKSNRYSPPSGMVARACDA